MIGRALTCAMLVAAIVWCAGVSAADDIDVRIAAHPEIDADLVAVALAETGAEVIVGAKRAASWVPIEPSFVDSLSSEPDLVIRGGAELLVLPAGGELALYPKEFDRAFGPGGEPMLRVSLDRRGSYALRDLTTTYRGRRVALILNGSVTGAPEIMEPLTGPFFVPVPATFAEGWDAGPAAAEPAAADRSARLLGFELADALMLLLAIGLSGSLSWATRRIHRWESSKALRIILSVIGFAVGAWVLGYSVQYFDGGPTVGGRTPAFTRVHNISILAGLIGGAAGVLSALLIAPVASAVLLGQRKSPP